MIPLQKMNYSRIILVTGLLLISCFVSAQTTPSITVSVDKNRIMLGEPFHLKIEAILPRDAKPFTLDSIPHFEFLEKPVFLPTVENGSMLMHGTATLTSFDSGHWEIPSIVITAKLRSDPIPIDVIFSDFDPNQDYHDIKDIIQVKKKKQYPWLWWAAGGGLLLLILLKYLLRKKKPVAIIKPVVVADPYEEAMRGLESLKDSHMDLKTFHSRLIDIFRLYLFRRKGILSLQKTTNDLVLQIKTLDIGKEQFDKLSQSLRLADFVKFAKYIPGENDNREVLEDIRNAIMTIEKTCSTTG